MKRIRCVCRHVWLCISTLTAIGVIAACATDQIYHVPGADAAGCRAAATFRVIDRESFEITSPLLPGTTLSGELVPSDDGIGFTAYVDQVEVIAAWPNGWTYARLDASGAYRFVPRDSWARVHLRTVEPVELWTLTVGEVRYYDRYIRGAEGLIVVQARIDRAQAYAELLGAFDEDGAAVTYTNAERRRGHPIGDALAQRVTGSNRPDWLVPLVESGTVQRDIAESADLIEVFRNWYHVVDRQLATAVLATTCEEER